MTDTPPEVMQRYRAMLLARSPEERLKMGCSMGATARALVRASVMAQDPHASPAAVRAAIAGRGAFNLIHQTFVIKVDFIVRKETDYRRVEFARQRRGSIEGCGLAIVAPEDLIISKLDWTKETRSEVHLTDVRNLLRSVPDLDTQYLAHWIERLGLGRLYQEALGD